MNKRTILISFGLIIFLGTIVLMNRYNSFHAIKGSLTEPNASLYEEVRTLIDADANDILTIREMRRALRLAIAKIAIRQPSYDFSEDGVVNRTDLILFVHSLQYLLTCGDGQVVSPEECDDAGTVSDDGCSAICTVDTGFTCTGSPSDCTNGVISSTCGNGAVETGEQCDDGNTVSGDGCSGTEAAIPNGACKHEFCGDGYRDADGFGNDPTTVEQCDDGSVCQGGLNDANPCTKFLDDPLCGDTGTCMKIQSVVCSSTCTLPTP